MVDADGTLRFKFGEERLVLPRGLQPSLLRTTSGTLVVQASGVLTTHYMAIEETLTDNKIFVTYDLGGWSKGMKRDIWGRFVEVASNLPAR